MYVVRNGIPTDVAGYACAPANEQTATVHGPKHRALRFQNYDDAMQWILDRALMGAQVEAYWRVVRLVPRKGG